MGKKSLKSPTAAGSAENSAASTKRIKLLKPKSPQTKKNVKQSETKGKERRPNPATPKTTTKKVKQKEKKDETNKPKKPPTAFFYFLEDFRKGYKEEHPEVKSMRDIGKACSEKWKTMSYEEKVPYYDTATVKRAEFEKAMVAYTKRKERGEDYGESDEYE